MSDLVCVENHALLADAVEALPTEAQRAFFRLLIDALISRYHLRADTPSGWPSFVAVGPTKTGKSLVVLGVAKVFGLNPARVIRSAPAETERSLWGRRYSIPGGEWGFKPVKALSEPLLVLEELDKAPSALQRSCLKLLQGETTVPAEGDVLVDVAPTVVALANADVSFLPDEYRRRSIVLDTSPLVPDLDELHEAASTFMLALPSASFDLAELQPVIHNVPLHVKEKMLRLLKEGLNDRGWRLVDERALGYLILGRFTLMGSPIIQRADEVVADYLSVASTVYETADAPSLEVEQLPAATERATQAEQTEARARATRTTQRREEISFGVWQRRYLEQVNSVLRMVREWPEETTPPMAASLDGAWDAVGVQLEKATTVQDLHEIAHDAWDLLGEITNGVIDEYKKVQQALALPDHGTWERVLVGCVCQRCEAVRIAGPPRENLINYAVHGTIERFFSGCTCRRCVDAAMLQGGEATIIEAVHEQRRKRFLETNWRR